MPFPLVPVVALGLGAGAWYAAKKRKPKMTPARKKIYEEALRSLKDTKKLRTLADEFEKEGLKEEAETLRKRAMLRELPPEQRKARSAAFKKALGSKNAPAIRTMADALHKQGATGAAAALRQHAVAVERTQK